MDRTSLLLGDATPATRIIEIGPSHAPIAPKRAGWNAFVVDHADQAELRAKYTPLGVDIDAIEVVDAVWAGGRLDQTVAPAHHGSFDRLIASHVIEHIPDLVTFLVSCQTLLAPEGVLALAVPDKRYCFDMLKPISTTGDIMAAYDPAGAGRHFRRTVFNQVAYSVHAGFPEADNQGAWGQHAITGLALVNPLSDAFIEAAKITEAPDSAYTDAHAWQFTPGAFQLAMLELAEAGLIDWHVADCTPALGCEFIATLRRGRRQWAAAERDAHRLGLLLAMQVESREMIDFLALGGLIQLSGQPRDPALARGLVELRALIGAQQTRLDEIGAALAPPADTPPPPGSLADVSVRLDHLQQQLASITAADGTQASIMGALAAMGTQQGVQQSMLDSVGHLIDAQMRQISSLTAADGTQASIMGSLSLIATRQQHQHQAINDAAMQTIGALRALESLATRVDDQRQRLEAQQRTLDEVHQVSQRLNALLAPLRWLKRRLTGRKPA
jgi:hypothetical protein